MGLSLIHRLEQKCSSIAITVLGENRRSLFKTTAMDQVHMHASVEVADLWGGHQCCIRRSILLNLLEFVLSSCLLFQHRFFWNDVGLSLLHRKPGSFILVMWEEGGVGKLLHGWTFWNCCGFTACKAQWRQARQCTHSCVTMMRAGFLYEQQASYWILILNKWWGIILLISVPAILSSISRSWTLLQMLLNLVLSQAVSQVNYLLLSTFCACQIQVWVWIQGWWWWCKTLKQRPCMHDCWV